jgi:regulator of sirC expression with transglutaminase-like and TPR domain
MVLERLRDLQPQAPTHWRDLGLLHYRNGALRSAVNHLTRYLILAPSASDADSIRHSRDALVEHLGKLN